MLISYHEILMLSCLDKECELPRINYNARGDCVIAGIAPYHRASENVRAILLEAHFTPMIHAALVAE